MTDGSPPGGHRPPARRWSLVDGLLLAAFVALWALIAFVDKTPGIDVRVVDALPPRSGPGSVAVVSWPARLITDVGEPTAWTIATLTLAVVLALTWRSWVPARLVVLPVVVEAAIVLALKAGVHRSGPPGELGPRILGYFPSGHTATAFVCTGALATLVSLWRPAWRRRLRVAVLGWALLMAASLVWYRYHWLTDVLASLLLGLLMLRLLCAPLWAPEVAPAGPADASGDHAATQDDALRLREDA